MTDRIKIALVQRMSLVFYGFLLTLIVVGSLVHSVWFFVIWLTLTLTWFLAVGLAGRNYPHRFLGADPVHGTTITLRKVDDATRTDYVALHDDEFAEIHGWDNASHQQFVKKANMPALTAKLSHNCAVICLRDTDATGPPTVLGALSLAPDQTGRLEWTIGAHLFPSARGQGYMLDAIKTALPLWRANGLEPVHLGCDPDNEAMMKVAERSGMQRLAAGHLWHHGNGSTTNATLFRWPPNAKPLGDT